MMKLFYVPGACSLAGHIALEESGLPHEIEAVDLASKRTASGADYYGINKNGYVPALRLDDGAILTENVAILTYIADKAGTLKPATEAARWAVLAATAFVSTEIHQNTRALWRKETGTWREQSEQLLAARFRTAADMVGDDGFLVGDALSVADCYLFVMLRWAEVFGLAVPDNLKRYRERLAQRPAFVRALRAEGLG